MIQKSIATVLTICLVIATLPLKSAAAGHAAPMAGEAHFAVPGLAAFTVPQAVTGATFLPQLINGMAVSVAPVVGAPAVAPLSQGVVLTAPQLAHVVHHAGIFLKANPGAHVQWNPGQGTLNFQIVGAGAATLTIRPRDPGSAQRDEERLIAGLADRLAAVTHPDQLESVLGPLFDGGFGSHAANDPGGAVAAGAAVIHPSGLAPASKGAPGAPASGIGVITLSGHTPEGAVEVIADASYAHFRAVLLKTLGSSLHSLADRVQFMGQVALVLERALKREGVTVGTIKVAVDFLQRMATDRTSTDFAPLPDEVREVAGHIALNVGRRTDEEQRLIDLFHASWGRESETHASAHENLLLSVARSAPEYISPTVGVDRFVRALRELTRLGLTPASVLVLELVRASRPEEVSSHFASLRLELQHREPDVFNPVEPAIFYTILAERMDLSEVGIGSYLSRVRAMKGVLESLDQRESPWLTSVEGGRLVNTPSVFKPTKISYQYTPVDVSDVNRQVIAGLREEIRSAHERIANAQFDGGAFAALPVDIRTEMIERAWAYLFVKTDRPRMLTKIVEAERELELIRARDGSDAEIRPLEQRIVRLREGLDNQNYSNTDWRASGKAISRTLKQMKSDGTGPFASSDPIPALTADIRDFSARLVDNAGEDKLHEGFAVFAALNSALTYINASHRDNTRPLIAAAMAENLMAYQWGDDVARTELKASSTDLADWDPVAVLDALDRLRLIFTKKSASFVGRLGDPVDAANQILATKAKRIEDEVKKIRHARIGKGEMQTMEIVPIAGVTAMMRGYFGHDCSKSMDVCRGSLALRAAEPWTFYYAGVVGGKFVGYGQMTDARIRSGGSAIPVLLADLMQFKDRTDLYPAMLVAIHAARDRLYTGLAIAAELHPSDPHTQVVIAHFTNFYDGLRVIRSWDPYRSGIEFMPLYPHGSLMARYDQILGHDPYVYEVLRAQGFLNVTDSRHPTPIRGAFIRLNIP